MAKAFDLKRVLAPVDQVIRVLKDRRESLMAEVGVIDEQLKRFGDGVGNGRATGPKGKAKAKTGRKGKRGRRSSEELIALAKEVIAFIKATGETSGAQIKAKFGPLIPSTKKFLKQNAPDVKVKTTGAKAAMKYSV